MYYNLWHLQEDYYLSEQDIQQLMILLEGGTDLKQFWLSKFDIHLKHKKRQRRVKDLCEEWYDTLARKEKPDDHEYPEDVYEETIQNIVDKHIRRTYLTWDGENIIEFKTLIKDRDFLISEGQKAELLTFINSRMRWG